MSQKGISSIVIILIIVGILVIGGGIYWYFQKSDGEFCIQVITPAKNPLTDECKEFSTPCNVPAGWEKVASCPTQDETANWKTYRNEKYGFEMEHPKDWLLEEFFYGNLGEINFKKYINQEETINQFNISVENTSEVSVSDWFKSKFSDGVKPEKSSITVAGLDGIRFTNPDSVGECGEVVVMIKDGKLFNLSMSKCRYTVEFRNQILSTFKFTQ